MEWYWQGKRASKGINRLTVAKKNVHFCLWDSKKL